MMQQLQTSLLELTDDQLAVLIEHQRKVLNGWTGHNVINWESSADAMLQSNDALREMLREAKRRAIKQRIEKEKQYIEKEKQARGKQIFGLICIIIALLGLLLTTTSIE